MGDLIEILFCGNYNTRAEYLKKYWSNYPESAKGMAPTFAQHQEQLLNIAVPYPHTHKRTHDQYKIYCASEKALKWHLLKYVVD